MRDSGTSLNALIQSASLSNAKTLRPRFSYFPFGAGSRQCIGEGLAWMEGVLVLAAIVQQWTIREIPGRSKSLKVTPAITLRPKGGLPLIVERRA